MAKQTASIGVGPIGGHALPSDALEQFMHCDERMTQEEPAPDPESAYLTVAIVELASARSPWTRRRFVWIGIDAVPYFPKLQVYLARLSLSVFSQIVWLHVDSNGLPHPIELRFPAGLPTVH